MKNYKISLLTLQYKALDEINRKLLASLSNEWRPNVMAIEEVKNIRTITIEKLLRYILTHEHTLKRAQTEKVEKMKKKNDLALQLLMGHLQGLDQAFLSRNFKSFIKNKALTKKRKKRNEKPQCYEKVPDIREINVRTSSKKRKIARKRKRKRQKKKKNKEKIKRY